MPRSPLIAYRASRLGLGLALVATARPTTAAPQQWKEFTFGSGATNTLGTYPQDCAATHNGNRAAVRDANPYSNQTVISVYQLHTSGLPAGSLATFGGVQNATQGRTATHHV